MILDPNVCRSLLFVPAGSERYLSSALRGTADVIQIDLEDSVPPDQKAEARSGVSAAIDRIHEAGRVGVVRINNDPTLLSADLEAVVGPQLAGITLPKVSCGKDLQELDEAITRFEQQRQLPVGRIRLVAQIESAAGVLNSREIASATPRLAAMGIGMEDLAVQLGCSVNPDALYFPNMLVLYAAREAGVTPLGYLGSITVYNDAVTFGEWIRRAKSLGFAGGFCIHPNQVEILNTGFAPSIHEVQEAKSLIEEFQSRPDQSSGVFSYKGRMVDRPVVERARRTLQQHEAIESRRDGRC